MPEKEYLNQRSKKTASKQNQGHPSGKNNPAGAARKLANAEQGQANRNSKKKGPESRKKH